MYARTSFSIIGELNWIIMKIKTIDKVYFKFENDKLIWNDLHFFIEK